MIHYRRPPIAAAEIRIEVPGSGTVIVSAEAAKVAQEHIAWAHASGLSPRDVGAALMRRTPSWEAAADAVALAWQELRR